MFSLKKNTKKKRKGNGEPLFLYILMNNGRRGEFFLLAKKCLLIYLFIVSLHLWKATIKVLNCYLTLLGMVG
jgi:hypothetical protein